MRIRSSGQLRMVRRCVDLCGIRPTNISDGKSIDSFV
jgi:hypothetical protein